MGIVTRVSLSLINEHLSLFAKNFWLTFIRKKLILNFFVPLIG